MQIATATEDDDAAAPVVVALPAPPAAVAVAPASGQSKKKRKSHRGSSGSGSSARARTRAEDTPAESDDEQEGEDARPSDEQSQAASSAAARRRTSAPTRHTSKRQRATAPASRSTPVQADPKEEDDDVIEQPSRTRMIADPSSMPLITAPTTAQAAQSQRISPPIEDFLCDEEFDEADFASPPAAAAAAVTSAASVASSAASAMRRHAAVMDGAAAAAISSPAAAGITCTPELASDGDILTPPDVLSKQEPPHVCSMHCGCTTAAAAPRKRRPQVHDLTSPAASAISAAASSIASASAARYKQSKQRSNGAGIAVAAAASIIEDDDGESAMLEEVAAAAAASYSAASSLDEDEQDRSAFDKLTPEIRQQAKASYGYEWDTDDEDAAASSTNASEEAGGAGGSFAEEEEDAAEALYAESEEDDEDDESYNEDSSSSDSNEEEVEEEEAADAASDDAEAEEVDESSSSSASPAVASAASSRSRHSSVAVDSKAKSTAATKTKKQSASRESSASKSQASKASSLREKKGAASSSTAAAAAPAPAPLLVNATMNRSQSLGGPAAAVVPSAAAPSVPAAAAAAASSKALPQAPKKKRPVGGLAPLSPFPLVPPVLLNHSPRHAPEPYPSFDDLTSFQRSASFSAERLRATSGSSPNDEANDENEAPFIIEANSSSAAAAASSALSSTRRRSPSPFTDPYAPLSDPSLSLDAIFALAPSIPYNFSSVHAASKGWSFQQFSAYDALVNARRKVQAQNKSREKAFVGMMQQQQHEVTAAAASSDDAPLLAPLPVPAHALVYEQTAEDLHAETLATLRSASEHASLSAASIARGEGPLPPQPLAPDSFEAFHCRAWPRAVPASLESVQRVYERWGMSRGSVPLAELDLETPGGIAFRAVKYQRTESSQHMGAAQPPTSRSDKRTGNKKSAAASAAAAASSAASSNLLADAVQAAAAASVSAGSASSSASALPLPMRLHPTWFASILCYLDLGSLLSVRSICHSMHSLVQNPSLKHLWRPQLIRFASMTQLTGWVRTPLDETARDLMEAQEAALKREAGVSRLEDDAALIRRFGSASPPPASAAAKAKSQKHSNLSPPTPLGSTFAGSGSKSRAAARGAGSMVRSEMKRSSAELLELARARQAFEATTRRSPGEEWYLRSSVLSVRGADRSSRWDRAHQGLLAGRNLPFAFHLRFESDRIEWSQMLVLQSIHPFADTLHTLEIAGVPTLVNDALIPTMLLNLRLLTSHHETIQPEQRWMPVAGAISPMDRHRSWGPHAVSRGGWRQSVATCCWAFTAETCVALPRLTSLSLMDCMGVDLDVGLSWLPYYAPQLLSLSLGKCRAVGGGALPQWADEAGARWASQQGSSQSLSLRGGSDASPRLRLEDAPHNPLGSLSKLLALNLAGCRELHSVHVALLYPLHQLQVLDLSFVVGLDDAALDALTNPAIFAAKNATASSSSAAAAASSSRGGGPAWSLRKLSLTSCSALSAEGLCSSLPRLRSLEVLDISQIPSVSNAVVASLVANQRLSRLVVRFADGLTDSCASSIARMQQLSYIDLNFCSAISVHAKIAMKNSKQGARLHFLTV